MVSGAAADGSMDGAGATLTSQVERPHSLDLGADARYFSMDLCAQSLEGNQTILATGWLLSPDWSPDGSTLAYTRASGVDLEIPELQILTPGQQPFDLGRGGQPDWSPDGTQLVFTDGAADFANV